MGLAVRSLRVSLTGGRQAVGRLFATITSREDVAVSNRCDDIREAFRKRAIAQEPPRRA